MSHGETPNVSYHYAQGKCPRFGHIVCNCNPFDGIGYWTSIQHERNVAFLLRQLQTLEAGNGSSKPE
jgi:hypothetical protein